MARLDPAAWWTIRPARSRRPATYTCPLCGRLLHAMTDHALIMPEGDAGHRRHAHSECVARAREAGRLPLRSEWRAAQPRRPGWWRRVIHRV